jgi:glycosyltransferase involved in cell wall biosynthesis
MSIHLSIILPAYNEEDRLPVTLRKTMAFLSAEQFESEIIVVSDGSTDGTRQAVESFMGKKPDVRLIEYFPNAGKGAAVKRGMMEAAGDYRLFMDADYAVPIEFVSTFLSMMNHSYDIVIGSRGL